MTKKDIQSVSIRFPLKLYRRIKELANEKHRSFNLQTIHLINMALDQYENSMNESKGDPSEENKEI